MKDETAGTRIGPDEAEALRILVEAAGRDRAKVLRSLIPLPEVATMLVLHDRYEQAKAAEPTGRKRFRPEPWFGTLLWQLVTDHVEAIMQTDPTHPLAEPQLATARSGYPAMADLYVRFLRAKLGEPGYCFEKFAGDGGRTWFVRWTPENAPRRRRGAYRDDDAV